MCLTLFSFVCGCVSIFFMRPMDEHWRKNVVERVKDLFNSSITVLCTAFACVCSCLCVCSINSYCVANTQPHCMKRQGPIN